MPYYLMVCFILHNFLVSEGRDLSEKMRHFGRTVDFFYINYLLGEDIQFLFMFLLTMCKCHSLDSFLFIMYTFFARVVSELALLTQISL